MGEYGFNHLVVVHDENFVDPNTGAHTNTIEGNWHHVRSHMPITGTRRWLYKSYFLEYVYRQQFHGGTFNTQFGLFLEHVREVYNPYIDVPFFNRINLEFDNLLFLPEVQDDDSDSDTEII
ncbi:hypothetical protein RF11_14659 [Thelohanellus kitauei]|uniref:ISXO2-like transposase domain-containing protein n=1 Tax=Thelohanellus kitauei TaxID=669202 RepID=A0A0C2J4P6_THEKT|nr:hypothetical protein RF11_14659 [Thelohanellus kitauei]